jgi:ABC-2 type transport system ATP-binding protein
MRRSTADRVPVIAAGRIVAECAPATIGDRERAKAKIRYRLPAGAEPPADTAGVRGQDGFTELAPEDVTRTLHRLTGWAIEEGIGLDGLEVVRPSLEDVYLELTGSPVTGGQDRPRRKRRPWRAS